VRLRLCPLGTTDQVFLKKIKTLCVRGGSRGRETHGRFNTLQLSPAERSLHVQQVPLLSAGPSRNTTSAKVQLKWRKNLVSKSGSSFPMSELSSDSVRLRVYRKVPDDNVYVRERKKEKRRYVKKPEITRHIEGN
jgi:hypothetical protein